MKIILNSTEIDLINNFYNSGKEDSIEIINAKVEKPLFDAINKTRASAFIIDNKNSYAQKAVTTIKQLYPYIPIIIFMTSPTVIKDADIYMPIKKDLDYSTLYKVTKKNINNFNNNFHTLHKLTSSSTKTIKFENCSYEPTKRIFYFNNKKIKNCSAKEGGVIEILGKNFASLVERQLILEKVWRKTDYYAGRSMDVYVSKIRRLFEQHNIPLEIKNISGSGLVMDSV